MYVLIRILFSPLRAPRHAPASRRTRRGSCTPQDNSNIIQYNNNNNNNDNKDQYHPYIIQCNNVIMIMQYI